LIALLHDAPEYVIGDMISPVKAAIGPDYSVLDDRILSAVHIRFGLPAKTPITLKRQIKAADKISAWLEAVEIAGFSEDEANKLFGAFDRSIAEGLDVKLRAPREVRAEFVETFQMLLKAV
jgi:5'-deoxynucleotidase YfbR-like HD superfamily hydrolase